MLVFQPVDSAASIYSFPPVSILQLKQQVSRLSPKQRQELHLYLLRLKRSTPQWKRATAAKIRAMKAGKGATAEQLEAIHASRG